MPLDVMALKTEVALPQPELPPAPTMPDPELIDKAAALLADAKKPLVFVGGGAVAAAEEVAGDRRDAGGAGGQLYRRQGHRQRPPLPRPIGARRSRTVAEADVVLAVGTRLHQPQIRWGIDGDMKLIRIDIDPTEITRIVRPALGIVADAKPALAALLAALDRRGPKRASRKDELEALKARASPGSPTISGPQCEYLAGDPRRIAR